MQPLLSLVKSIREQKSSIASRTGQSHLSWWVEINTSVLYSSPKSFVKAPAPRAGAFTTHHFHESNRIAICTYYFGPFDSQAEARDSRTGYVDDLFQEGARDIMALIKHCQPKKLTIDQGYSFAQS
jgi:hypothetical protein